MDTAIFNTENAVFKFALKKVKERLICKPSEYDPDAVARLAELISNDTNETILNPDDHSYFGYVVLDLISEGIGTVICKKCNKTYDAGIV